MTDQTDAPSWLLRALAQSRPPIGEGLHEDAPSEVLPGDVCVVQPHGRSDAIGRLFLVTDSTDGWCKGVLMSAETELASEVDPILGPAESGLPYEVAVHSRYLGSIWTTQVRRRVGATRAEVLDQVTALAWNDEPDGVSLRVGLPLQPEGIDPRYPALIALSRELDDLTDHWRRQQEPGAIAGPVMDWPAGFVEQGPDEAHQIPVAAAAKQRRAGGSDG